MKIVVATRNPDKLAEIREILAKAAGPEGNLMPELADLSEFPELSPVIEDGASFLSNAVKKAVTAALATGHWTIADDSGLEVDALDGRPGVYSARYAGPGADHSANNTKLLAALRDAENRTARFRCVVAISDPDGLTQAVEAVCEGRIATECHGTCGFGYDPLFIPENHDRTFGELGQETKNSISHRAKALEKAANLLLRLLRRNR